MFVQVFTCGVTGALICRPSVPLLIILTIIECVDVFNQNQNCFYFNTSYIYYIYLSLSVALQLLHVRIMVWRMLIFACHHSTGFQLRLIPMKLCIGVKNQNISMKYAFWRSKPKVKVMVAVNRIWLVIALQPSLKVDFDEISQCWLQYGMEQGVT